MVEAAVLIGMGRAATARKESKRLETGLALQERSLDIRTRGLDIEEEKLEVQKGRFKIGDERARLELVRQLNLDYAASVEKADLSNPAVAKIFRDTAERADTASTEFTGEERGTNVRIFEARLAEAQPPGVAAGKEILGEATAILGEKPSAAGLQKLAGTAVEGVDVQKTLTDLSQFLTRSLNEGIPPATISEQLRIMANANRGNPGVIAGLDALEASLPASLEDWRRAKTRREIAAAQPKIDRLMELGVAEDVAALSVLGGGGARISIEPSSLTKANITAFQRDLTNLKGMRNQLAATLPLITEETVGIWQQISTGPGAIMQQIPIVRDVADAIGKGLGLDRESVNTALVARSEMMFSVARMATFIKGRGGRIAVQDREFASTASGLLSLATTAEAARGIIQRMIKISETLEADLTAQLDSGEVVPKGGALTVVPNPAGGFDVLDESGNVVNRIE